MTQFNDIYKIFLNSISNDYRLKQLFTDAPTTADSMLETWLIEAMVKFGNCRINFDSTVDITAKHLGADLSLTEQVILAELMILSWMEYNINNITQMNLTVQDRDFKTHAAERNLSGKVEYHDKWREKVYHEMSEYDKKIHPISEWASGNISPNANSNTDNIVWR